MQRRDGCRDSHWLIRYTGLFIFIAAFFMIMVSCCGRSLVWEQDGSRQLYTVLGYMGRMVRGLLRGERPPMLSFSLGQGMDVMTTCAYYGYTDPLCLLSAFFKAGGVEYGYALIALLRLYLAGVAAAVYMKTVWAGDDWSIACAAAIYAFDGFGMQLVGMHPFFLNGPLFLPLMLLGVERILKGRRWLTFVLTTALMILANFYFAYMTTVVTVLYIAVRLVARMRERGVAESAKDGLLLLGGYLLGAALAAIAFLPVVLVYLSNSRQGLDAGYSSSLLHYSLNYYKELVADFFAPWESPGEYTLLNYSPVALIGLLAMLFSRETWARGARLAICLGVIGLGIPAVGLVMNAGAYVSNRWSYALGLFVALGCAIGLNRLFSLKKAERRAVSALALAYAALAVLLNKRKLAGLAEALLIGAAACLLLGYDGFFSRWLTRRRMRTALGMLLGTGCIAYLVIGYVPRGYGFVLQEMPSGFYGDVASMAAGQYVQAEGGCRVGQGRFDDAQSLMFDYSGTGFYWSLVNGDAPKYYQDLLTPTQTSITHIYGLCGSAPMNAVASVRYVTQQQDEAWVVPYGFEKTGELALPNGTSAGLYENAFALPLGYAFDRALSPSAYDALPVEEKLRALTACAVCDTAALPQRDAPAAAAVEIPYSVAGTENVTLREGWIGAEDRGTVSLFFDAPEDYEIYLILDGFDVDLETIKSSQRGGILVESEGGMCEGNIPNPRNNFYFPKKGLAFCLGSGALHGCTLTFEYALNYRYDDIRIVGIPLFDYRETVAARRAEGMTDVRVSNDRIEGKIAVDGDRVLQIAVPYSRGWSARVDGEARSLFPCGGMYMGLDIGAGEHDIELRYVTPGLVPGAVISAAALLATAVLAIADRRRRRAAASSQKEK